MVTFNTIAGLVVVKFSPCSVVRDGSLGSDGTLDDKNSGKH